MSKILPCQIDTCAYTGPTPVSPTPYPVTQLGNPTDPQHHNSRRLQYRTPRSSYVTHPYQANPTLTGFSPEHLFQHPVVVDCLTANGSRVRSRCCIQVCPGQAYGLLDDCPLPSKHPEPGVRSRPCPSSIFLLRRGQGNSGCHSAESKIQY